MFLILLITGCFICLIFFLTTVFNRRKLKNRKNHKIREFNKLVNELISIFNQTTYKNVNILEEKMNELKELIKESDKRIAILKKYQDKKLDSKYQVISLLLELGYDIEEITKVLNLSFQEKDLLIEIYKRKKL